MFEGIHVKQRCCKTYMKSKKQDLLRHEKQRSLKVHMKSKNIFVIISYRQRHL